MVVLWQVRSSRHSTAWLPARVTKVEASLYHIKYEKDGSRARVFIDDWPSRSRQPTQSDLANKRLRQKQRAGKPTPKAFTPTKAVPFGRQERQGC